MKRYKNIDLIRGFAVMGMIFGHILNWWLIPRDYWLYLFIYYALGPIAAGGFLFISGLSAIFAYKKSEIMVHESKDFNIKMVRNVYIFRALLLLLISFIYNLVIAIAINDLTWIWAWFVLQTIGFSALMAWPFLKTSRIFRILFGSCLLIINFIILELLRPYKGQANIFGILYHILFNPLDLYPIIPFFVIFLIGTVVGDIIYEINRIENREKKLTAFKFKFFYPTLLLGFSLTVFGILFRFPSFFTYSSFSAIVYAIGIILIIISISFWIEEFELLKFKKNYNFFYYYSYYSFTVFLTHNFLYFLFYQSLNAINIWFVIIITLFLFTLLLRFIYKKLGPKASLKAIIGIISLLITIKLENRRLIKLGKLKPFLSLADLLKFGNEGKN